MVRYWASANEWAILRTQVWERDGGVCQLCGQPVTLEDYQPDHIIPRSKGGDDVIGNLRVAHRACNNSRHNGTRYSLYLYCRRTGEPNLSADILSKTARMMLRDMAAGATAWRGYEMITGKEIWRVTTTVNEYGVHPIVPNGLLKRGYITQTFTYVPGFEITDAGRTALDKDRAAVAQREASRGGGL